MQRKLTAAESRVLKVIEECYGPQDLNKDLHRSGDEAVLWIKDTSGTDVLVANLTNLAIWLRDDLIKSEADLKLDWLRVR